MLLEIKFSADACHDGCCVNNVKSKNGSFPYQSQKGGAVHVTFFILFDSLIDINSKNKRCLKLETRN